MSRFRFAHIGVASALAIAGVTGVGLIRAVGAAGGGTASSFVPIVPCRLVDTRAGTDNVGLRSMPIGPAESVAFAVWGANGNCTVPTTATGIATNVTAANPTAASYVTVFPADAVPRPTASNLNVVAGSPPTPNQVTVGLSATGSIGVYNNSGALDLIVDIVGYYQPAGAGATGPQGIQGIQGIQGASGVPPNATLSLPGTAAVHTGLISGDITATGSTGCVAMNGNATAVAGIPLPFGAQITGVTVQYGDASNAASASYSLKSTDPGVSDFLVSNVVQSIDSHVLGFLHFSTALPPVALHVAYFLDISTTAGAQRQQFCGAAITYTMP
ncbi:MAG: hypothetical protein JWL72_170 [Ilumatobacteraceae bacterium]|nr:hypothetical protein [Ilumatobacteraceae bacterium]